MATFVKSIEKEQAQQEECLALPLAIWKREMQQVENGSPGMGAALWNEMLPDKTPLLFDYKNGWRVVYSSP